MEKVEPFDWQRIFFGNEQSPLFMLEIGFRVFFIYVFAVAILRFMGKRGNKSLSVIENALIIALGSATGDVMFYPKVPLIYACIVISLIVFLTRILQTLQVRSKPLNTYLDGYPIVLIDHGELNIEGLKSARLRKDEFYGMLRSKSIKNTGEIEYAFFERTGEVGLFKFEDSDKIEGDSTFPDDIDKN